MSESKECTKVVEELGTVSDYTRGKHIKIVKFLQYIYLDTLYIGKPNVKKRVSRTKIPLSDSNNTCSQRIRKRQKLTTRDHNYMTTNKLAGGNFCRPNKGQTSTIFITTIFVSTCPKTHRNKEISSSCPHVNDPRYHLRTNQKNEQITIKTETNLFESSDQTSTTQ